MSDANRINRILSESQENLVQMFWGYFGEEMESERLLELVANVQLYTAQCMQELERRSKT